MPLRKGDGYVFESKRPNRSSARYRYDPQKTFNVVKAKADVPRATLQILRHTLGPGGRFWRKGV